MPVKINLETVLNQILEIHPTHGMVRLQIAIPPIDVDNMGQVVCFSAHVTLNDFEQQLIAVNIFTVFTRFQQKWEILGDIRRIYRD